MGAKEYLVFHDQKRAVDLLLNASVDHLQWSQMKPIDVIAGHTIDSGFLDFVCESFPDPRDQEKVSVPLKAILASQIFCRIQEKASIASGPYILNNSTLLTKLGFNICVAKTGFNDLNLHRRESIFCGDVLRNLLKRYPAGSGPEILEKWFNKTCFEFVMKRYPKIRSFVVDTTDVEVLLENTNYQRSGITAREEGEIIKRGYKVALIRALVGNGGILVGFKMAPINDHDIIVVKALLKEIDLPEGSEIIWDRAFIDADFTGELKEGKKIDTFFGVRTNMMVQQYAVAFAENRPELWKPHPNRKNQEVMYLPEEALHWPECKAPLKGVLVRWKNKRTNEFEQRLFLTTKTSVRHPTILATYDQRAEIEEDHRQLKENKRLEKLPATNYAQLHWHVLFTVLTYVAENIFFVDKMGNKNKIKTTSTFIYKRPLSETYQMIIYAGNCYAILPADEYVKLLLDQPPDRQAAIKKIVYKLTGFKNA